MPELEKELDVRVNNRYRLKRQLGKGGYGEVWEGVDVETSQSVAVKLERARESRSSLANEIEIYHKLAGRTGIPQVYWSGRECDYNAMVFELLGPNLEDLFNYCDRRFSLSTVLLLADQLICRLAYIHAKKIIHRDIKPENLLMGRGKFGNIVYVTDIGLAEEFTDELRDKRNALGTARYASINAHCEIQQTPADDMESLGYILVYFLRGKLPWQGLRAKKESEKYKAILEQKRSISSEELCDDLPIEFNKYFDHIRLARVNDRDVDYRYLRQTFSSLFKRSGFEYDNVYDWTLKKYIEHLSKPSTAKGQSNMNNTRKRTRARRH